VIDVADLAGLELPAVDDVVGLGAATALHNLLDAPGPPPGPGQPLPVLWHWLAFLPRVPQAELGPDGHPKDAEVTEEGVALRRMFAGARIEQRRPIAVDQPISRSSRVSETSVKEGRSGRLIFVTWRHEIHERPVGRGEPLVVDEQDLVYRAAEPTASAGGGPPGPAVSGGGGPAGSGGGGPPVLEEDGWPWRHDLDVTPSLLFRFSALTYNAHRIHYDRRYAEGTEGYSGLVVHGPLQAIALAELCRRAEPGRPVDAFRFRAQHVALEGRPLRLRGRPEQGAEVALGAFDTAGRRTMSASATLGTVSGR
jgi:3-methylfumaryl-CoA hydratase